MKELQNILPIELEDAFSSPEFENDGGLEICSVEYLENELLLNFSFYSDEHDERRKQYWQLSVNGYIESKIGDFGSFMSFYSEHILLAEFQDIETELYFKRKGDYPELLLTSIFELHTIVFDNLIPIEKFTQKRQLLQLCKSETGLFAKGPKSILSFYFDLLQKAGKEPYYFGEKKRTEYSRDFKLVLIGGTYIIGEEFNFIKLNR